MAHQGKFISLVPEGSPHQVVGERVVMLSGITLEILTTRRIELDSWILKGLNDPFWRLYLPVSGQAIMWSGDDAVRTEITLEPGKAYLIPPRTTLHSWNPEPFSKWYVHFTLGPMGDRATPGIFPLDLTDQMAAALARLGEPPLAAPFPWASAGLVSDALCQLSPEVWTDRQLDARVERAMDFMHANLNRKLTNADVARAACLSVRNLNHLFNQHV